MFSKPVDHTTITGSSFFLHAQNSSTRVEARLSYDAAALRAELDPVYTLEAMTTYAVEITAGTNGIKDISGNSLTSGMTAIFATKAGKLRPRAPIVLSGQKDTSISGVYVKNLNGPCIIVQSNSQNVIVRDSELGPCQGGIIVDASITSDSHESIFTATPITARVSMSHSAGTSLLPTAESNVYEPACTCLVRAECACNGTDS